MADRKKVIYVAGPMTGLPDFNYGAFHYAAVELRARGYDVRNPAEHFGGDQSLPWDVYMRRDIQELLTVDAVAFLPGWEKSKGAQLEYALAKGLGLELFSFPTMAPLTETAPAAADTKDTNPKDGIGATKAPLALIPPVALAVASLAHLDGALKYGAWNWRKAGVRASIYIDAALRHLMAWHHGEAKDSESGVHHLGHALACLNILLDSEAAGLLVDDRPPSVPVGGAFKQAQQDVVQLRAKHAHRAPRHYTIADTAPRAIASDAPGVVERFVFPGFQE